MLTTVGEAGYGLGIARRALADGTVIWGRNGGIFGYLTSSFHTADAASPEADDLVAEIFSSGLN